MCDTPSGVTRARPQTPIHLLGPPASVVNAARRRASSRVVVAGAGNISRTRGDDGATFASRRISREIRRWASPGVLTWSRDAATFRGDYYSTRRARARHSAAIVVERLIALRSDDDDAV
jgi:hypothetical protein